ncbi:PP2C family serine/threonine-protein phosphatase [Streptomyces nanshensis]|uniref:Uncharacterized protein n=1 Tax=Streptomyces nanshensis TaxID=518642 RepID=A0A1E7KZB5_9ACTN|nr:PP2C family serine/threonine-protein phosphatase [Streptomyces nanshensis]OEV09221.1 hypothetical protein AN218_22360 [Streptomyces nanshensis]
MSDASVPASELAPALATREGTGGALADAGATYTSVDGTVAVAVTDGIGHEQNIVTLAPVLAQVASRVGSRRGALAGLLTAALLVEGSGVDASGPDAVAALVVARPGGPSVGVWAGDTRIYGVAEDGALRQYSTDETLGQQFREWGVPVDVARLGDDLIRQPLSRATAATMTEVLIPGDETVVITSDGVHDQVEPDRLATLASKHATEPRALADALVSAARADADGYRDDATALVLPRGARALGLKSADAGL